MHPRRPPPRGFTLIELLFTLVLLGILIALATPAMTGWIRRTRMTAVLNQLVADIQYAKMLAVRSGQRVEVQMLPAGAACVTEYSIVIKSTPTRVAKRVPLPDAALGICLERTSPTTNLSFNTRGLPNAGRTFWVHHVHMADTLRLSMAGRLARAR